jgi:hypothetical protein
LPVTPSQAQAKDYCLGFQTCTFDDKAIYFDLSNDLWANTRGITVRRAAEAYCADHPDSKVYVDLGGEDMIEGTCRQ